MKLSTFTQAVLLMLVVAFAASCRSSRSTPQYPGERYPDEKSYPDRYPRDDRHLKRMPPGQAKKVYGHKSAKVFAPGQQKKYGNRYYPMIIRRSPGLAINKTRDGRYYYRNQDGFYYWQGYDERLFIDETHLSRIDYDRNEYEEWKSRGRRNSHRYEKNDEDDKYDHRYGKAKRKKQG